MKESSEVLRQVPGTYCLLLNVNFIIQFIVFKTVSNIDIYYLI